MTISLLSETIISLEQCGFEVAAIVCDLGGGNRGLLGSLNVCAE